MTKLSEKTCTRCQVEKPIEEYYKPNRYECIECERVDARERMRRYNGTMKGKASQALRDSKKAVNRIEAETGRKVTDDLNIYEVIHTLHEETCLYCEKETDISERSIEHLTPIRHGGSNSFSNIRMACMRCNRTKADLPVLLHLIHEETEPRAITDIIGTISLRSRKDLSETFEELGNHTKSYFSDKAEKAIAAAEESEGNTE